MSNSIFHILSSKTDSGLGFTALASATGLHKPVSYLRPSKFTCQTVARKPPNDIHILVVPKSTKYIPATRYKQRSWHEYKVQRERTFHAVLFEVSTLSRHSGSPTRHPPQHAPSPRAFSAHAPLPPSPRHYSRLHQVLLRCQTQQDGVRCSQSPHCGAVRHSTRVRRRH